MGNSLYSYELLKIARKSWQYVVSDEVVYAIQDGDVIVGRGQRGNLDAYLEGNGWIEFLCYPILVCDGQYHAWIALVERDTNVTCPPPRVEYDYCSTLRLNKELVIGAVREFSQDGQKMGFRAVRSMVRLKVFDVRYGRRENVGHLLRQLILEPSAGIPWTIADGKLRLATGFTHSTKILNSQLPHNIIEAGSQTVSDFTHDGTPRVRDEGRPLEFDFPVVVFGGYSQWIALVSGNSFGQPIEATFRPVTLEPTVIQFMRRWNINHEKKTSDTKDSQRARDSRAHKGRVSRKSQKNNQALTCSQPEEVASQTSPAPRSDGYTAKHTRSGRAEDA